ncbi:MAG: ATP-dependent RNA helicase RhlB [Proteobacteria bacterium]|nr:ATP-dependent RNA helicase RhlB [Pseudomonadota bacterium]MBU1715527.1 ATP-dependent RNA helicase RhlB [Pseudomonadota bacterium]
MIKKFFKTIRSKLSSFSKNAIVSAKSSLEPSTITESQTVSREAGPKKHRPQRPRKKKPEDKKEPKQEASQQHQNWDISKFQVTPEEGKVRFHDFELPAEIMHGIADLNFEFCTPIQIATLKQTLSKRDAIGRAQTGTGKTAAFLITIFTNFLSSPNPHKNKKGTPRALIIAPTRELVIQIGKDAQDLAKYCPFNIITIYGGTAYQRQQQSCDRPLDMIVATPGRLLDFQRQGIIDLSQIETMVIDEADRMLDMGFIPDVRKIIQSTPNKDKRQTLFYSATMTPEVNHLAAQWTKNPVNVEIEPEQVAVETVNQVVYLTTSQEKYTVLYNLIINHNLERVMIFANRRDETRKLTERLKRNAINCEMISGDVAQNKRTSTLDDFRSGKIRVLVATDVAGRGIHIDGVSHVINYTLPYEPEDYVHRIGRTGRAGASGISISFASEDDAFYLPEIEKYIGQKLPCVTPAADLLKTPPRGTMSLSPQIPFVKKGSPRSGGGRKFSKPRK